MPTSSRLILSTLALALAGCAASPPVSDLRLGPQYTQHINADQGVRADWWTAYGDAGLDAMIARALSDNHDVRIALSRVQQARAGLDMSLARLLPSLSLVAGQSDQRSRLPEAFKTRGSPDIEATRLGAELGWELDLFGAARASRRAFGQDALASESAAAGARLLVSAEVARHWFLLKAVRQQLQLVDGLVTSSECHRALVNERFQAGLASAFERDQAEAEAAAVVAERPGLVTQQTALQARLAVLIGVSPLQAASLPQPALADWPVISPVAPGQPLDLLSRRPDLVAAEHQLAAEGERLTEARRSYLPRFFLSAVGGTQNLVINGMTQNGIGFSQVAATFSLPLFSAGRIAAQNEAQSARRDQALLQYEKQVLTALEEVEASLAQQTNQREALTARQQGAEARARGLAHGEQLRARGQIDQIQLEALRRASLATEQRLTESRLQLTLADIQLHKALGGGWHSAPETRPLPDLITAAGDTP